MFNFGNFTGLKVEKSETNDDGLSVSLPEG